MTPSVVRVITTLTSLMTNNTYNPVTLPFSGGYELVQNAEVRTYGDDEAIMDFEMLQSLEHRFGRPLVGFIGGLHYQFKSEKTIPAGSVAIPSDNHSNDPDALLIQK